MVLETSPKKHWLLRTTRATISGTLQYQQGVATNFGSLFSMKQRKGKALKDYLVRFNAATLKIYDLNQDVAMMIVIQGLHSSWFTYSQNKMTPRSYSKLLAWTQKYIHADEGATTQRESEGKKALKKKRSKKGLVGDVLRKNLLDNN